MCDIPCKSNSKSAFTLLELLLSILITAILLYGATSFAKNLYEQNHSELTSSIAKMELHSAIMIINKNPGADYALEGRRLLQNGSLLLDDVSLFKKDENSIEICIKKSIEICRQGERQ